MSRMELPLVTPRSWAEIERRASDLLRRFYPERLKEPGPLPIAHFLEIMIPKHFGIPFEVAPLPYPAEAITMPGNGTEPPKIIMASEVYDRLHANDGRARFTAGHESGHGIFHAKELHNALVSGTHRGLHRKATIKPFVNPERQADVFASRFLMPQPAMRLAIQIYGPNVRELAGIFQVSVQAMHVRLGELGVR